MSDSVARGAANPQTIREHLEAIQRANTGFWPGQYASLKRLNREHAVAALDLLDNLRGKRCNLPIAFAVRLYDPDVPDPAPRGDADACQHEWRPNCDGATCSRCGIEDR